MTVPERPLGAVVEGDGVRFRVWAPASDRVEVVILAGPDAERIHPLDAEGGGWWGAWVDAVRPGMLYRYRLDEGDAYPDPASRAQPEGVFGPSAVVDPHAFPWTDGGWRGRPLEELVIYELHVGTATSEGTFDALATRLPELVELGVTALELMPVAQCPGERNWGYDGVHLFAPSAAYGGPEGLRRLVDAAHRRGLAVILDVVYNHLGPEGNWLYPVTGGRFFTARHRTPWGDGIDYDGPSSAAVREFVLGNALHWAHEYHVDGLRLDATHAIQDDSPTHIVAELAERVRASLPGDRHFLVMAEDERNDPALLAPRGEGGWGLDAVWADDFHHQVRVLATGEREGYFAAYRGTPHDLAETVRRGWFFGDDAAAVPPQALVHCVQNHDQVGNRAFGDRLHHGVELSAYRAACALLLLSPYTPLLWMGQEWAASTPFQFFTDFSEELGHLVTEGRRNEFREFSAFSDPATRGRIPDPQARETFLRSRLDWGERERMPHAGVLALHRELLALRASHPALRRRDRDSFTVAAIGTVGLALRREGDAGALLLVASFKGPLGVDLARDGATHPPEGAEWSFLLSSEEARFGGGGGNVAGPGRSRLVLPGAGAVLLRAGG